MLLHEVLSFVHHAFGIWDGLWLHLWRWFILSFFIFAPGQMSVLSSDRIRFRSWLNEVVSLYRFCVLLTRVCYFILFLFWQFLGVWLALLRNSWLNVMHRYDTCLYVGDSLLTILACCCSVHKCFVQLLHRIFFKPLPLLLLKQHDYFILLIGVYSPGRQGLLHLSSMTWAFTVALYTLEFRWQNRVVFFLERPFRFLYASLFSTQTRTTQHSSPQPGRRLVVFPDSQSFSLYRKAFLRVVFIRRSTSVL